MADIRSFIQYINGKNGDNTDKENKRLSFADRYILELVCESPIYNVRDYAKSRGISYNTLRQYLPKLIAEKYLIRTNDAIVYNNNSDYTPLAYKSSVARYARKLEDLLQNLMISNNFSDTDAKDFIHALRGTYQEKVNKINHLS